MSCSRCVKLNLHQISCIQAYLDDVVLNFFFLSGQACVFVDTCPVCVCVCMV